MISQNRLSSVQQRKTEGGKIARLLCQHELQFGILRNRATPGEILHSKKIEEPGYRTVASK